MNIRQGQSIFVSGKSWYVFHGVVVCLTLALIVLQGNAVGRYVDTRLVDPIRFHARDWLELTPPISSELKVYALDDSTFSFLGRPRLSPDDMVNLLRNIAKQKPRAILIDGLLSDRPVGPLAPLQQLKTLTTPIYTGTYISPQPIAFRNPLNIDQNTFQLTRYLAPGTDPDALELAFDHRFGWYLYGHHTIYDNLFAGQGHITYNHDGTISPFYQITPEQVVPHVSLYAAKRIEITEERLLINEKPMPVGSTGRLKINHRPPQDFYNRTRSLRHAIKRARTGEPEPHIKQGDVVLILLAFATGNTDFHEASPFGEIPGGLIIASMISDIIDATWLRQVETAPLLIVLMAALGTALGINGSAGRFWVGFLLCSVLYTIICLYLFAAQSLVVPWFFPYLSFCSASLIYFAHVRLQEEFKLLSVERNYYSEKSMRLERETEKAKLEGYLSLGKAVQKLLLPETMVGQFHQFHYKMIYHPHMKMAGDWLFTWPVAEHEYRIIIGDVMGKGPSAAIPVASIITVLREAQLQKLNMTDTLRQLNSRLISLYHHHITSSVAAVSLFADGHCTLYNAGSPGWFSHAPGQTNYFMLRSNPLGLTEHCRIAQYSFDLPQHSTLITFTDGYLEGSRELNRFLKKLQRTAHTGTLSTEILESHISTCRDQRLSDDDQSLLLVRSA